MFFLGAFGESVEGWRVGVYFGAPVKFNERPLSVLTGFSNTLLGCGIEQDIALPLRMRRALQPGRDLQDRGMELRGLRYGGP